MHLQRCPANLGCYLNESPNVLDHLEPLSFNLIVLGLVLSRAVNEIIDKNLIQPVSFELNLSLK